MVLSKDVRYNPAFEPLFENKSRHLFLYGGAGSGKSHFAIQKILWRTIFEDPHKFVLVRKQHTDLEGTVIELLERTMHAWGIYDEFIINKQPPKYKHILTGNTIICRGLDQHHRIQSLEGATGMFVEEATEFTEEDIAQLNLRIRGNKENYVQYIYSFNPIDELHHLKAHLESNPTHTTLAHFTYHDNLFIDEAYKEILEGYKKTIPTWYDVYCLGKWGVHDKSNKFLFNFNESRHVGKCGIDDSLTVRLSFDFNLDPFAVIVYQKPDQNSVRIIDKVKTSSDIEQVCDMILANYGERAFIVTGDASGKARTGVVRGKTAYWTVVKNRLKLKSYQIRLRAKNIDLLESKLICNAVLNVCDVKIDPKLKELISDCNYAAVDDHGMLIKDRKHNKNDFLDTIRYLCDAEWPDIVVKPNKYT